MMMINPLEETTTTPSSIPAAGSGGDSNNDTTNESEELLDILNSLADTFITETYSSFEDLFMSIEEAYWYYIDIHLIQNPRLPKPDLQNFAELILKNNERLLPLHEALLNTSTYASMIKKFEVFKRLIPRYGAIILNKDMKKIVLVKEQWWGWGFPKGKGKEGETETASAAREVFEEIGFDISKFIKKDAFIQKESHGVIKKFFIAVGVDEFTDFETHTRYEISRIKWHNIEDIPLYHSRSSHQFAAIITYMKPLMAWIENKRKESGLEPIHFKSQSSGGGDHSIEFGNMNYKWTNQRFKNKDQSKVQIEKKEDEDELVLYNEVEGLYIDDYITSFKEFLKEKEKNINLNGSGNNTPKLNSNLRKMESININLNLNNQGNNSKSNMSNSGNNNKSQMPTNNSNNFNPHQQQFPQFNHQQQQQQFNQFNQQFSQPLQQQFNQPQQQFNQPQQQFSQPQQQFSQQFNQQQQFNQPQQQQFNQPQQQFNQPQQQFNQPQQKFNQPQQQFNQQQQQQQQQQQLNFNNRGY
ncbi:hypothetical protein CYY_001255 [Polysphondylium violaceum]|uniref:Nudix hydrolase domain-containing protein n=1 Tax=Polysphondylium violaceum TaxID=133409 RepID=A0A8J4Q0C3_9MYCE|nr:hypothetical protein CYY_001255 [Polysphondylium violaceum]